MYVKILIFLIDLISIKIPIYSKELKWKLIFVREEITNSINMPSLKDATGTGFSSFSTCPERLVSW